MHRTSRRLLGGLLALALVGLSACSSDDGGDAAASGEGWSFTDDLGNTVELDAAPSPGAQPTRHTIELGAARAAGRCAARVDAGDPIELTAADCTQLLAPLAR